MHIDQKTLQDLSVFHKSGGLYEQVNLCTTLDGSQWLKQHMQQPPATFELLKEYQDAIRYWTLHTDEWSSQVSNGTLLMVEKFFSSPETIISKPTTMSVLMDRIIRKLIPRNEQSLVEFSISQVMDFVQGCYYLVQQHLHEATPALLRQILGSMQQLIAQEHIHELAVTPPGASYKTLMTLSYHTRRTARPAIKSLVTLYARMDGLRAMALAINEHQWSFPGLLPPEAVILNAEDLYHPLLARAVPYSVQFSKDTNFLFLTGANMSGKSTFIRSIGTAAYMAHLGMGVPARSMEISFLDNLITNMQIEDNIFTGESYFLAEVQRIRNSALQLSENRYNLVLMDELFKGTNVHDAYECTRAVIRALLQSSTNIMALSTHLYELGEQFAGETSILFRYFETELLEGHNYRFTYRLKEGVSNDRIGYLVLKKEGVLEILGRIAD